MKTNMLQFTKLNIYLHACIKIEKSVSNLYVQNKSSDYVTFKKLLKINSLYVNSSCNAINKI